MASTILSPAGRVEILLRHFGLERVHVAACMSSDWDALVTKSGDRLCSLTLVAPHLNKGVPDRLHVFNIAQPRHHWRPGRASEACARPGR